MSQRIPFVYSTECRRPLASALALCLTLVAGCIHLEPEPLAPSTPSPQREQGKPSGVSWKNPFDNHDAAVVPAQVVLPESDSAPAKKPPVPSISPEPPTAAALLAPAIPPAPAESPVDLQIALSTANTQNPTIGLADEAVRAALAERTFARALLLPTLNSGFNFRIHKGSLLSSSGIVRYDDVDSLYVGLGAYAKGADSVTIPGVRVYAHLGDAIFEPREAAFRLLARRYDSAAVRNQVLLEVVQRYFELLGAEARLAALRQSATELAEIVRLTANFAKAGQGREGDAQRAQAEAQLLRAEMQRVEEEAAVAAAQLAALLSMDTSDRFHTDPATLAPIYLVDQHAEVAELLRIAASNRPEVGGRAAEIREAETRLRQERARPLLPLVSFGFSYGTFGGGGNLVPTAFGNFSHRADFEILAVWSLQNLGFGNRGLKNRARSNLNQAMLAQAEVFDEIGREVAEAHAQIAAAQQRIEVAKREFQAAEEGFHEELNRTRNLKARPIEVLNSLNQLRTARLALIQATIDFNQAQFRLYVALGQPPMP